jgi:triacylglycerol lipase
MKTVFTAQFSAANLANCARLSRAAYYEQDRARDFCAEMGAEECRVVDDLSTDTQAFVAIFGSVAVVSFRGSSSICDFKNDAVCDQGPSGHRIKFHKGFARCFTGVIHDLNTIVANIRAREECETFIFTGHSLGGALALMAGTHYAALGYQVSGVYTFGQPRVGNPFHACYVDEHLAGRFFRCVHESDPVTRIPWMFGSYRHAGMELFFERSGLLRVNPTVLWKLWYFVSDLYVSWVSNSEGILNDHAIENYVRACEAYERKQGKGKTL